MGENIWGQALKIMAAAIEWFDCANKLDYDGLPPYHCWFSKLKNEFVLSPEKYDDCQRVFLEWKIGTFADWLEYYNNVDIEPFLKAVESMRDFYTLLGVSMKYLVWGTLNQKGIPELYAPGEEAYEVLKDAVVGGLSLVFCRKHKVGKTRNCSHKFEAVKMCREVLGYNANALYPSTMLGNMPCSKEVVVRWLQKPGNVEKFLRFLQQDKWFGFAKVKIKVPRKL